MNWRGIFEPRIRNIPVVILACMMVTAVVLGALVYTYTLEVPQTVDVELTYPVLIVTINGTSWTNGTSIDWGTIYNGTTKTLPISIKNNNTNLNVSITFVANPLPSGWNETCNPVLNNYTLASKAIYNGNMTLTVPPNATAQIDAPVVAIIQTTWFP